MAGKGGYQRPNNPAPVSGPGRLSRRTDGGPSQNIAELPNAGYGEASEFAALQGAAPMSASPSLRGGPPAAGLAAMFGGGDPAAQAPTPLTAGTERPDEPVTAGAPIGPGPGPAPEVAPMAGRVSDLIERMLGDDLTGELADMYEMVRRQGL